MNLSEYIPYMNDTEIVHLMRYLDKEKDVLEIGCGHSTIFLSKLVNRLVAIEHNVEWGTQIYNKLKEFGLPHDIKIIPPNYPQPHSFHPAQPNQFDNYVNYIKEYTEVFDLVIVDGRDRVRCATESIKNLKMGGFMIIHDFWNRSKYHSVLSLNQLELVLEKNSYPTDKIDDTLVVLRKIKNE